MNDHNKYLSPKCYRKKVTNKKATIWLVLINMFGTFRTIRDIIAVCNIMMNLIISNDTQDSSAPCPICGFLLHVSVLDI